MKVLLIFVILTGITYSQSLPFLPATFRSLDYQCAGFVTEVIPAKNTTGNLNQQVLYAKTDIGGVYKSSNNGTTWTLISTYHESDGTVAFSEYVIAGLAVNPSIESGNELLVAWGNNPTDASNPNINYKCIWRSTNGGANWIKSNFSQPYPTGPGVRFQGDNLQTKIGGECIMYDPRYGHQNRVLMGGIDADGGSPALFMSLDNGANFTALDKQTIFQAENGDQIVCIAMNEDRTDMFVGTTTGVYYSSGIDANQQPLQFQKIIPTSPIQGTNVCRILMKSDGNTFFAFTVDNNHGLQGGSLCRYNSSTLTWTDLTNAFNTNSGVWAGDENYFCMLTWALDDESILLAGRLNNPIKKSSNLGNNWSGEETLNGNENIYMHYDQTNRFPNHQYRNPLNPYDEGFTYMYGGLNFLIKNPYFPNTWYLSGGAGLRITNNAITPAIGVNIFDGSSHALWHYSGVGCTSPGSMSMPVIYDFTFENIPIANSPRLVYIPMADWSMAWIDQPTLNDICTNLIGYDNQITRYNNTGNTYISNVTRTLLSNHNPTGQVITYNIGADTYDPENNGRTAAMYKRIRTATGINIDRITQNNIFTTNNRAIVDGLIYDYTYNSVTKNDMMVILVGTQYYQNPPLPSDVGIYWTTNNGNNFTQASVSLPSTDLDLYTATQYSNSIIPSLFADPQYGYLYSDQFNFAIGNVQTGTANHYLYIYLRGGGMFVSSDGGMNWASALKPTNNLSPGCLRYLVSNQLLLAIQGEGLFYGYLNNDGTINSWQANYKGFTDASQVEVKDNIWVVFGKRSGDLFPRLYKTTDWGNNWTHIADGLRGVRALRIDPQTLELFIGTSGLGTIIYNDLNPSQPIVVNNAFDISYNTHYEHDIEIDSGGVLNISGNISYKMAPGKRIYVKEGGKLNVNGVTFNCTDSTQQWAGIYFENSADSCSIQNSTFNNATLPIKIVNDDDSYIENGKVIANNVFNTQNNNIDYVIYAENSYNMKIENNQFNMMSEGSTTTGIYTKNHDNGTQNNGDGDGGGMSGGRKNTDVSKYAFLGTNPVLPEQVFGGAENQKGNSTTEDPTPQPIFIKILYNTFNGGNVSMILTSYISERNPYYICGNTFTGDYMHNNIIGRMMTGRIRNNYFSFNCENYYATNPIYLEQSNVDMFQNSIYGMGTCIVLNGHSFINLAPTDNGTATLTWNGGQNYLYSAESHNIVIADVGYPYTNYGLNTFDRGSDMNYFNIFGILDSTVDVYYARNNECNLVPHNFLYSSSNPYIITDSYSLYNVIPDHNGYTIVNKGQDVYDTIFTGPNNINDTVPQDEILYSLANGDKYYDEFFKAICDFKLLIDNYPSSIYVAGGGVLYNLYDTYQLLDTGDYNHRNYLYSDLMNYLDAKIQSGNYDESFNDVAYNLYNICGSLNINYYYEALTGFQFVAMFHPDAELRLLASWDAAELEELMNMGGGVSNAQLEEQGQWQRQLQKQEQWQWQKQEQGQEKVQKEFRNKLLTKLDIAIGKDSVMKIMKKIYDAKNKEIEGNSDSFESSSKDAQKSIKNESNIKSLKTSNNNQKVVKTQNENSSTLRQNDRFKKSFIDINQRKELISRAERNLRTSRSLSAEERQKRQKEDMLYIAGLHSKINKVDNNASNTPSTYKLYQNYPNPFNPVTKIKYELPMDSKVTLVVYDVLGRQMTKLVSDEFKKSGTYTVEFNGQAFASGVYFYQIQMGNYVQTKKMVLVK
jgi:hypothetical protein